MYFIGQYIFYSFWNELFIVMSLYHILDRMFSVEKQEWTQNICFYWDIGSIHIHFTWPTGLCNRNLFSWKSQRPNSIGGLSQAKSRSGAPDQCETKKENSEIPEIPTSGNMGVRRASLDEWRSSSGKPSLLTQSSLKSDIQDVMTNIKKQSNQG